MSSHLAQLTAQEIADLDASDGVADGKIHGIDASKFVHDKSKSTKEGEWELRDGKYYRRDYYASTVERSPAPSPPKAVAPPPPARLPPIVHDDRDRIIAELRREIEELRRLLHDRDSLISELRLRIHHLEIQISQVNIKVETGNSYYVVRSQRGADLLRDYGKISNEILINPMSAPPPVAAVLPTTPVFPPMTTIVPSVTSPFFLGGAFDYSAAFGQVYTPVERSYPAPQVSLQTTQYQTNLQSNLQSNFQSNVQAQAASKSNEYYRVDNEEMRRKIDLLDGVEDGKYNGAEIRVSGSGSQFGGGFAAASGSQFGAGFAATSQTTTSRQQGGQEYYRVSDEAMRRKLDLMDGVEDGKFNNAEIRVGGVSQSGGFSQSATTTRVISGGSSSSRSNEYYRVNDEAMKHKLDMMDGVQDGKLRGAEIRVSGRF